MMTFELSECDKTPINTPSFIQPIGFMIITNLSFEVINYAGDAPFELALNKSLSEICPALLRKLNETYEGGLKKYFSVLYHNELYDFAVHSTGKAVIIEALKRFVTKSYDPYEICKNILDSKVADEELDLYYDFIVNYTRGLSGFDRVMLYRFDNDGNGEVIAEAKESSRSSFLHHHFPASDIPLPAREQYFIAPVRFVLSASNAGVFLRNASNIDMSECILRGVADIHREYLRNMGVESSLSISIKIDGKLWGLIACHNYTKADFTIPEFRTYELLSQIFSKAIAIRLQTIEHNKVQNAQKTFNVSCAEIKLAILQRSVTQGLMVICKSLHAMLGASVVTIVSKDKKIAIGYPNNTLNLDTMLEFLINNDHLSLPCFYNNKSDCELLNKPTFEPFASLAITKLNTYGELFVFIFKDEFAQTITWAGKPAKDETGGFLSPRESFEAWIEIVRGKAIPFDSADRSILDEFIERTQESIQTGLEILDITAKKEEYIKYQERLTMYNYLQVLDVMVLMLDVKGNIKTANKKACEILEYEENNLIGLNWFDNFIDKYSISEIKALFQGIIAANNGHVIKHDNYIISKTGKRYLISWRNTVIKDQDKNFTGLLASGVDVSELYHGKQELERLNSLLLASNMRLQAESVTDTLTGVLNRRIFDSTIIEYHNMAISQKKYIGYLMLDIDSFKQYNDTYGHSKGDQVLKTVALEIENVVKNLTAAVFRIGGEEFFVVMIANSYEEIVDIAKNIRIAIYDLKIKHVNNYNHSYVSISGGLKICYDCNKLDLNNILVITDKALYNAKANGRNMIFVTLDCIGKNEIL